MPPYVVRLRVANPLAVALQVITGEEPPTYTHGVFSSQELSDENVSDLQDWCSFHARPFWSTGIGVLEAAELIVQEAVDNGNIAGKEERPI